MTDDTPFDRAITTRQAFSRALTLLLHTAHINGVDVSGPWECRNGDEGPDWEAIVTELAREINES